MPTSKLFQGNLWFLVAKNINRDIYVVSNRISQNKIKTRQQKENNMKSSTSNNTLIEFNSGSALGLRLKRWLALLLVALSLGSTVNAQLAVVNGDFSNITGLTSEGGGWYYGIPYGWSNAPAYYYAVNVNSTPPTCNIAQLNYMMQGVGTLTNNATVILSFDNNTSFSGSTVLGAAILDAVSQSIIASNTFPTGLGQSLIATNVPSGTAIAIQFWAVTSTPGLAKVQVRAFDPLSPPQITQQPAISTELLPATSATLSVIAVGLPPLVYQWQSNGVPLTGATGATLSVNNPANYTAVVTAANSLSVTSAVAQVITIHVLQLLNGNFASNHLPSAWGASWAHMGQPSAISGWNASSSDGALNFDRFSMWAAFLSMYSPSYDLQLNLNGPVIMDVPFEAGYADQGGSSVTVTLWVGATPMSQTFTIGQTLNPYVAIFTNTTATGDMVLNFTGSGNFLTGVSSVDMFNSTDMPIITQQPTSYQLSTLGGTLNLVVGAVGIMPVTYQWRTNGVALSGQTSATLTINNVTAANSGNYTVVVIAGNSLSVTSQVAQVIVPATPPLTIIADPLNGTSGTLLNGTTPASRSGIGGNPWGAGINLVMDGTEVSVSNTNDSAFVPFAPDAGNIYTLSCDMDITSGDWIGLAFSQYSNPTNYSGFNSSGNILQAWMCQVQSGYYYLFIGPELNTSAGEPYVGPGLNFTHTNAIVLNTVGQNWTVQYFVDGTSVGGPNTYSSVPGVNPAIGYVGIGSARTGQSGTFQNFKLEAVIPRIVPSLSLVAQTDGVNVSWPVKAGGWVLETTPSLTSPSWTAVSGVTNNNVTVTAGGESVFFRLHSIY